MERKNKKIVAGMMAGFCVLSTQSVLGNFSKLPMRGGNGLISYAMVDDDDDDAVGILDDNNVYDHCQYRLDDINKKAALAKCINTRVHKIIVPEYVKGKDGTKYRVKAIYDGAFVWCLQLKTIFISQFVEYVGDIFTYYSKIARSVETIDVDPDNQSYKSIDGDLYYKKGTTLALRAPAKERNKEWPPLPGELRTPTAPLFKMEKLHIELPESLLSLLGISDYYFSYGDK